MIVPTMTIPEAIASAKADIPALYNKTGRQIQEQEREHRKNRRAGDIVRREEYLSPSNNKWLYVLTTNKKHSIRNFFTWFHAKEGIFGLQPSSVGLHFLFTPHFFTRYRERVAAPTRCANCPGLALCVADCPREAAGWAYQ